MQFFNIINGQRRHGDSFHQGINPRTGQSLWDAPLATTKDLDEAVSAARLAQREWGQTSVAHRQALLSKLSDRLESCSEELVDILMQETGKSSLIAGVDIRNSINQTIYYTKVALEDEVVYDEEIRIVATHMPLGLVGAICPWNFPIILSNIKIVSAIVTGNCVLIKPSPFTPYSVLKSIELAHDIFPPGVVQVLNGGADLGIAMTMHPGIAKISFTGTTEAGKKVMENCSKTLKRLTLELAGNDAGIVCGDVDIKKVASQVATGTLFNGGQMCVCTKRVYVHDSIFDEFLAELKTVVKQDFAINDDASAPTLFGPLSNKQQFDNVGNLLEDSKASGHIISLGGEVHRGDGFWVTPTIISKPPEDSRIVLEEQFGPIIPLLSWTDEDDVIKRANLSNAGLGAAVYSSDVKRAERIARRIEAGTVWINMAEIPHPGGFFGGQKDSGHGARWASRVCFRTAILRVSSFQSNQQKRHSDDGDILRSSKRS